MKKILVAIDGSETSVKAAEKAVDIAKLYGCELVFVAVVDVNMDLGQYGVFTAKYLPIDHKELIDAKNKQGINMLNDVVAKLDINGLKTEKHVLAGNPFEKIIDFAEDNKVDLIVMGRRGLSRVERFFMGSVTQRVLAHAPCSVLVIMEEK